MMQWLASNIPTLLVLLALAVIVGGIVWKMIRDRRAGKTACSCGCSGGCSHDCAGCGKA